MKRKIVHGFVCGWMLGMGVVSAQGEVLNGTNYGSTQYNVGITNQTAEVVNNVKFCTPLSNTSDITNAGFLANWSVSQYLDDWDGDGIAEVCYDFTSAGNLDDFGDGRSGEIVVNTSSTMSPLAMKNANGTVQAWGAVDGDLIFGGEVFYSEAFNPYSSIDVVSANGRVTGIGIDCANDSGDCSEEVYWGNTLVLSAVADSGYEFDGWSGCPGPNGSECSVTSAGPVSVTANYVPVYQLTVSAIHSQVVSESSGKISCPDDCSDNSYSYGDTEGLIGSCNTGYHSGRWSGDGVLNNDVYEIIFDADKTAVFQCVPESSILNYIPTILAAPAGRDRKK